MRSVVFRILRLERNSKIFDGKGGEEVDSCRIELDFGHCYGIQRYPIPFS